MLLSLHALKSLNSIEKTQSRIMSVTFNSNPSTTITSSYSPTNSSDELDITIFYNELSSFVQHISKHNVLIIRGDMNAQIGKDENKFCLHNLPKRNGGISCRLFTQEQSFMPKHKFKKRGGKTMSLHLPK